MGWESVCRSSPHLPIAHCTILPNMFCTLLQKLFSAVMGLSHSVMKKLFTVSQLLYNRIPAPISRPMPAITHPIGQASMAVFSAHWAAVARFVMPVHSPVMPFSAASAIARPVRETVPATVDAVCAMVANIDEVVIAV